METKLQKQDEESRASPSISQETTHFGRDKSKIHAAMYHKIMSSLNCNRKLLLYTRDTPKYF